MKIRTVYGKLVTAVELEMLAVFMQQLEQKKKKILVIFLIHYRHIKRHIEVLSNLLHCQAKVCE